jgi:hypothetical protein
LVEIQPQFTESGAPVGIGAVHRLSPVSTYGP